MSLQHIAPLRLNFAVFIGLMVLLALTVGIAYVDLGWWNFPVSMLIAVLKALMIVLVFMHVRYSHRLTWIFSSAGLLWLAIMLILTVSDYLSRGWLPIEGK